MVCVKMRSHSEIVAFKTSTTKKSANTKWKKKKNTRKIATRIGLKGNENLWLHFIFECSKYDMKHNLDIYSEFLNLHQHRNNSKISTHIGQSCEMMENERAPEDCLLCSWFVFMCLHFEHVTSFSSRTHTHSQFESQIFFTQVKSISGETSISYWKVHKSNIYQTAYTRSARILCTIWLMNIEKRLTYSWTQMQNQWNDAGNWFKQVNHGLEHQMLCTFRDFRIQCYCICIWYFELKRRKHRLRNARMIPLAYYIGNWALKTNGQFAGVKISVAHLS